MLTSAREVIVEAMALIGAIGGGQTATGQDMETCCYSLNAMLDSWATERLACFDLNHYVLQAWSGQTFTMGPGGDIDVARPVTIEDGCFARKDGIDYPMSVISHIAYAEISDKGQKQDIPTCIRYYGSTPLATGYLWPVPTGRCDIFILLRLPFPELITISSSGNLPPGYRRAIAYSLAEEIAPKFGRALDASIVARAALSRRNIKRSKYEVPLLRVDQEAAPSGSGGLSTGDLWGVGNDVWV